MSTVIRFFNGAIGRSLRFLLGVALIVYGLFIFGGAAGALVAIVGLAPIGLALRGRCLLEAVAPLTSRAS